MTHEKNTSLLHYSFQSWINWIQSWSNISQTHSQHTWPTVFEGAKVMKAEKRLKICSRLKETFYRKRLHLYETKWCSGLHSFSKRTFLGQLAKLEWGLRLDRGNVSVLIFSFRWLHCCYREDMSLLQIHTTVLRGSDQISLSATDIHTFVQSSAFD